MKKKLLTISCFLFSLFLVTQQAIAYDFEKDSGVTNTAAGTGHIGITEATTPQEMIALGINVFLSILGVIFLGLTLYAGFVWMTARGNSEEIEKAKQILARSIIGLAVILGAFAITAFVMGIIHPVYEEVPAKETSSNLLITDNTYV